MTPICFAWIAALLLLPVLFLLWATESQPQRIRRFKRQYGWSQQRIADRLGTTRYQVRLALS